MFYYCVLAVLASIVAGIIIAARTKKAEGIEYGILDKIGIATNILLIPVYAIVSLFFIALIMLGMNPDGDGLIGVISVIVCVIGSTGPALWGLGLGASVAWRKKGKRVMSFLAQFAGVVGFGITLLFFVLFENTLFASLN